MELGDRLKEFGITKFGSISAFAKALGMKPPSLYKYLNGNQKPGADFIFELINLGCDAHWLLTGQGSSLGTMGTLGTLEEGREGHKGQEGTGRTERTSPPAPLLGKERGAGDGKERGKGGFEYPVVSLIGAGEVIPFDNEPEEHIVFPYKHKNCVALRVQGDSMIPFIEDGDVVLVDLMKRPNQGDIVAVRTKAGEQFVKKLMVVERNKKTFHLFSLNPAFPLRAFNFEEVETVKKVVMVLKDTDYEEN